MNYFFLTERGRRVKDLKERIRRDWVAITKFAEDSGYENGMKEVKKHNKKKDNKDRRLRADELEKKEYGDDVKPIYSDEELEEIAQNEQEEQDNSWMSTK